MPTIMHDKRFTFPRRAKRCLAACLLLLACHGQAMATVHKTPAPDQVNPLVSWHDGRLTVKARSVPLQQVLDAIAKNCNLRIFTPSAEKIAILADVDVTDQKVEQVLADLLKGCNYLVVYNEARENTGLVASRASVSSSADSSLLASSVPDEAPLPVRDEKEEQADYFRQQIEVLRERIASGASDRMYAIAVKTKSPEFVQDDRKLLASYEERLANLTQ